MSTKVSREGGKEGEGGWGVYTNKQMLVTVYLDKSMVFIPWNPESCEDTSKKINKLTNNTFFYGSQLHIKYNPELLLAANIKKTSCLGKLFMER